MEQNYIDSYSFRATNEGGFLGLFRITKTKVPQMTVVRTFCYQSNWLVASIVYWVSPVSIPENTRPVYAKARTVPIGIDSPLRAVARPRSLSPNHRLHIMF